ncbi:hypothetical protein [Georgenia subflava]|uniref:Uncharacterized protein n=1 Tax=Georgenia subflava TaxID=1622177 RepID=A0A6N7EL75_9MICO|nr:hypothetical protein [Georgenia subflava]MPV37305.1 hypothetical protein [Georgenia subflava]
MVRVLVTATVKASGGPSLDVGGVLEPESYTFAGQALGPAGGDDDEQVVPLLPDGGAVALLALAARRGDGSAARVQVTPAGPTATGTAFEVDGALFLPGAGVLAALVEGGPRSLTLTNHTDVPVTVEILTGLDTGA